MLARMNERRWAAADLAHWYRTLGLDRERREYHGPAARDYEAAADYRRAAFLDALRGAL